VVQTLSLVLLLIAASIPLALLARWSNLPYAVALVLGGMALAFVPFIPRIVLDPQLVLVLFLPPLLQAGAFFMPWRPFRANLRPILLLAIGLVACTTAAIGFATKWLLPDLPWAVCFALGAIVSPPDAVAATAVLEAMRLPKRIVVVLEGESLVNDASGLILYDIAIAAALTGVFSWAEAGLRFVLVGGGGTLIGVLCGLAVVRGLKRLHEPMLEIAVTMLLGYAAYIAADRLGLSGVLATVAAGLVLGWNAPEAMSPQTRIQAKAAWDVLVFLLNSLVFLLIGLSLNEVVARVAPRALIELSGIGALLSLVAIAVRMIWVFPAAYLPRFLVPAIRRRDPYPPWRWLAIIGWTGMRGVVSLAAALAIPNALPDGTPFPGRDAVLVLTFVVILITLVGQAPTLGPLIRRLGIAREGGGGGDPHAEHRRRIAAAGLAALAAKADDPLEGAIARDLLPELSLRAGTTPDGGAQAIEAMARLVLLLEARAAERRALLGLHRAGELDDDALRVLQEELDLEELRLRRSLAAMRGG
jgi:CPA1 family monovalent cation:H+ antiporter